MNQTSILLMQETGNKGIVLPITLIIIVLVVTVLILMFMKPNQKQQHKSNQKATSIIDKCNQIVLKYKNVTTELATAVFMKSKEIALYQDEDMLHVLKTYVETANKKDDAMSDYIYMAREYASINDVIQLNIVVQAMEIELCVLESILNEVKNLKIKDIKTNAGSGYTDSNHSKQESYRYHETRKQQTASDLSVYFKGCRTKEELIARYKSLAKTFHPDANGGNTTTFQEMKAEYDKLLKEYVYE